MKKQPVQQQCAIKKTAYIFGLLLVLFLLIPAAAGQSDTVLVEYFYEDGCLKCQQSAPIIDTVVDRYDNINYSNYEIRTHYGLMKEYGVYSVPTVVINKSIVITYSDYEGDKTTLEDLIVRGIENAPPVPDQNAANTITDDIATEVKEISPLIVLIAGILAGFNPCLLAVMAFLASITLSSNGGKKDMLTIILGFCAGIFTTYMIVGLGILKTVNSLPGIRETITLFMVVLISALGIWHIYDAYHLRKHDRSTFKTPRSMITFMNSVNGRNALPLSFLAGGLFSFIKAPCVGAIYLSILDMLITKADTLNAAFYLGIYNLGLVLPVILLGVLLAAGLNPETVTQFREKRRAEIRLTTGIILIALALLLNFNII